MTKTNAEITLDEIFQEFEMNPDRHSLAYRYALNILDHSFDRERDEAYDVGYDDGKSESEWGCDCGSYEEGKEAAWEDFNFHELVEKHLEETIGFSASLIRIEATDGDEIRIDYRYQGETKVLNISLADIIDL